VVEESVYSDGSGSAGVYEVYGVRFSGIHSGERVTVTPLAVRAGHRGGREKGIVRSGARLVERHVAALVSGGAQ
jgi:hypothetical protein